MTHFNSERDIEAADVEANSGPNKRYDCELCDYNRVTEHGLNIKRGHKHKVAHVTTKCNNFFPRYLFLILTPSKEPREEQYRNSGIEMSPEHQCEILIDDSTKPEENKGKVHTEKSHCKSLNFTIHTNDILKYHIRNDHS